MSLGERIKLIRKEEKLTLEQFGERIDLKKSALSQYERGTANPSDRTIRAICRVFHVREEWLRDGVEPMKGTDLRPESDEDLLARMAEKHKLNARDMEIVRLYLELTPEGRAIVRKHIAQIILELLEEAETETKPLTDEEIATKMAAYERLLKGEQEIRQLPNASTEMPQHVSGDFGASAVNS